MALIFLTHADLLEDNLENRYRVRAYRKAARSIYHFPKNLTQLNFKKFDLLQIPNVGKVIAHQIHEIIQTGEIAYYPKSKSERAESIQAPWHRHKKYVVQMLQQLQEQQTEIVADPTTLISYEQIKGDLHCHTWATDGLESIERMVQAAEKLGYEYIAITDHSKRLTITNGMDETRLLKQIEKINELNAKLKNIKILKSIEVDILKDGSLDLSNEVLKELDFCVCSIHSFFKLDVEKQTERIIRAMDNPYFNILGHATGRIIHFRHPYPIDIERILFAAKERRCFVELNAQPSRLDIDEHACKLAKEIGVKIAISSDAHSIRELDFMQIGVLQARRSLLTANDVLNTNSLEKLKIILQRI